MGCTLVDSLKNCGLVAKENSGRVVAKEFTFQGNFQQGLAAWKHASVQLGNRTASSSKKSNAHVNVGAVAGITGCTVVDTLESSCCQVLVIQLGGL
jgi:hypothetical protein